MFRKQRLFPALFSLCLALALLLCLEGGAWAAKILIKEGARGEAVRHVQELLIKEGFLKPGEADGVCGKITVAAVKKFQKAHKLKEDGIVGELTYKALSRGKEYEPPPHLKPEEIIFYPAPPTTRQRAKHLELTEEEIKGRKGTFLQVEATAYSPEDPGLFSHTATGKKLKKGIIAVDPSLIPLHSRVLIPGYGEAVAEDIGSGIKGHIIDVAFNTHKEALAFGRRYLVILVLAEEQ